MKIKKNILTNASIYVMGSFFTQGLTFIMLPIFSRLMEPDEYGLYSSYNFWISIIGIILGLQLSASIGNVIVDFGHSNIYEYISSLVGIGFITFIIILGGTFFLLTPLTSLFEIKKSALIIGVFQCFFIFCLNCLTTTYRFLEKPFSYIVLSILNSSINIGLSVLLLIVFINEDTYMGRVYSSLIAALLTGGTSLIIILNKRENLVNKFYWRYGLRISVPLIFHSLAGLILAKIDQMIILKLVDASSAGVYSYSNSIGQIISVLYTALNQAFVPWYYKKMKAGDISKIQKLSEKYIEYFTLLTGVIILVIPEVITIISDKKYYMSIYIVPVLFLSYFMNYIYTFPVNYEFYLKKTKYIAIGTIISMIINIVLDIILIPQFGSIGAAFATLASYLFLFVLHYYIAKYKVKNYELSLKYFLPNILILVIVLIVYYICIDYIQIRYTLIGVLIVLRLYSMKNYLIKIINKKKEV